jgi:hypothetical protein
MPDAHDSLRAAVAAAIERHGIMRVSRDADVAPETLRKYLRGREVRSDVLRRLMWWADPSLASDVRENWPVGET